MKGKKHLLHSVHHLLTGGILVVKGIDKVSHHAFIGSLFLLFGLLILGFFGYTLSRRHLGGRLELMVRCFEALVCLFSAYIFFTEGKTFLPYAFLLAAIGFLISIYVFYQQKKQALH